MSTNEGGSPSAAQRARTPDSKSPQQASGTIHGILSMIRAAPPAVQSSDESSESDEDPPLWGSRTRKPLPPEANPVDVNEVVVPKAGIVAVPSTVTLDELVSTYRKTGRTRLPVFEHTLDQPLGFVHLKDVALRYGFNGKTDSFDVTESMRPLMYVPPSMPISDLLRRMQRERCHMALVIDEYGGVDGLVTIEDLLEHHVGEIHDEHDSLEDDNTDIRQLDPNSYLVPARIPISDVAELIGSNLADGDDDDEVDSLGGWISKIINRIPKPGEVFDFAKAGIKVRVIKANARRIDLVQITRLGSPHHS